MSTRKRAGLAGLSMAVLLAVSTLSLLAQEPAPSGKTTKTSPPGTRKAIDPTRRVPFYFGQIGLTPEQRESIYKIIGKHQVKIDALEKQIAEIRSTMMTECEGVLTDTQKQLLEYRRRAANKEVKAPESPAATAAKSSGSASN